MITKTSGRGPWRKKNFMPALANAVAEEVENGFRLSESEARWELSQLMPVIVRDYQDNYRSMESI